MISIGVLIVKKEPFISLKNRWDKIRGMFRRIMTWEMLSLVRNRFRKSMILFMR